MKCPDCHGTGRIRKRFLLFFRRRARCPKCLGTGEYPPPRAVRPPRVVTRWRDDNRDTWSSPTYRSTSRESIPRQERFEVGSGGRSGGGGASASWDDSADSAPVIVDPFSNDPASASGAVASDSVDSVDSVQESDSSSPSPDTSVPEDGTAY